MNTYKDFYLEVANAIPKLPIPLAKRLVNRAWRDIQDSRQWSFLKGEGILYCPAIISSGSITTTQFTNAVVCNATAITALNNLSNPLITLRQIRFGSGSTPIYNIKSVSPTFASDGILYLDRPYMETGGAKTYRCYRCYYGPPIVTTVDADTGLATTSEATDFLRYNNIYNPSDSRWFVMPVRPKEQLDVRDPQRSVTGNIPYYLFAYKTINNVPYFEMWPHPFAARALMCSYQRRATEFSSDTETLPSQIPDELLMERSMFYACEWASKKQNQYIELKGINWKLEQASHKQTYSNMDSRNPGLLEIAQRNDEEAYPQNEIFDPRNTGIYPIGDDDRMVYASITP